MHEGPVPSNPYRMRIQCPACGRGTSFHRITGLLYSHTTPDTTDVCPASRTVVADAVDEDVVYPEPLRYQPGEAPPDQGLRGDEPSNSVRALRGGLPGLGRRR